MGFDEDKLFRERLKSLREASGLSQTQLEEKIGKEANYITRVETGRISPPIDVLIAIAHALKMSMNDLFFFEGLDDSVAVLRAKIRQMIETDDVKLLRKYYRLLLVSHED